MKKILLIITMIVGVTACTPKKVLTDIDTLPKDVSLKPDREIEVDEPALVQEREDIRMMRASIDSLRDSYVCRGTDDWRVSPIGSKPCGGPASYIAYHKEIELEILPKIQEFTRRQAAYNQKRNLFSDCRVEPQPSGVQCKSGQAVLLYNDSSQASNVD